MLPKGNRIRKTREFERVFASKQSIPGRLLRLVYTSNNLPITRYGIIISTKVSKKAVVRNKLRRRLQAIISRCIEQLLPPKDIVIICSQLAGKAEYRDIEIDLKRVLEKVYNIQL